VAARPRGDHRDLQRHPRRPPAAGQTNPDVRPGHEPNSPAHREGGFLGIGGTETSDHEQDALNEIAAIFDEAQSA
jgi:hypothetical protein